MKLSFQTTDLSGVEIAKIFFPNNLGALVIRESHTHEVVVLIGTEYEYETGTVLVDTDVNATLEAISQIKSD